MENNIRKFKRGVSPVIAVVLLIALTIASVAIVWAITQGLLGTSQGGTLVIENVGVADKSGNDLGDYFRIVVRNIGSEPTEIDSIGVKINDASASSWVLGGIGSFTINNGAQTEINASTINSLDMVTSQNTVKIRLYSGKFSASDEFDVSVPGILASEAILYASGTGLTVGDLQAAGWTEHRLNTGSHGAETTPVFTVVGADEITVGTNNNDYLFVLENSSYSAANFIFSSVITNGDNDMVGYVFRFQDVNNYYWVGYTNDHHSAANRAGDPTNGIIPYVGNNYNRWSIGKVISGSTQLIASGPIDASFNGNNAGTQQATVQLVASDTTFVLTVDGQEVISIQDTSISATGFLGLISIAAQNCRYGSIIIQR